MLSRIKKLTKIMFVIIGIIILFFLLSPQYGSYEFFKMLRILLIAYGLVVLGMLIFSRVNLPNFIINKFDFSMILFTFYLVVYIGLIINQYSSQYDVVLNWLSPKITVFSMLAFCVTLYTFIYRIKYNTLKDTFSLYKFLSSKHISYFKKGLLIFAILLLLYAIVNIDFNSGSIRRMYLIVNKIVYASVMYLLIYYVTFYVEILSVVNGDSKENFIIPEINNYKYDIDDINEKYRESINDQLKAERMKSDLITNVSHDIRTPLTSIISYVDLLCEKKTLDDEAKDYIQILNKKSWRLNSLIDDLMDATRLSSGNKEVELEILDLYELVSQVEADFEEKISKKNLSIIDNYEDESIYIYADSNSTSRVLENIYGNISKYAMPNTRVYLDMSKENDFVVLTFKNISFEALNIDAEDLVERFVRADESRNTEGNGLGLYIAQSLMELMDGRLELEVNGDLFISRLKFKVSESEVA